MSTSPPPADHTEIPADLADLLAHADWVQDITTRLLERLASGESWQEALTHTLIDSHERLDAMPPGEGPLRNAWPGWNLVLERLLPGMGWQGDSLSRFPPSLNLFAPIGPQREWHDHFQTGQVLWQDFLRAQQAYVHQWRRIGRTALHLLGQRLSSQPAPPANLGFAEMLDLWLDSCEAAYRSRLDDDFVEVQGTMINALLRVLQHRQNLEERILEGLRLPTRRELDTAHLRLQDSRRDLRQVHQALASLQTDVQHLRTLLLHAHSDARQQPPHDP